MLTQPAAAHAAIGRIEDIVSSRGNRRRGKKVDTFGLTARELEVLQQSALLGSNAAIASALDISGQQHLFLRAKPADQYSISPRYKPLTRRRSGRRITNGAA